MSEIKNLCNSMLKAIEFQKGVFLKPIEIVPAEGTIFMHNEVETKECLEIREILMNIFNKYSIKSFNWGKWKYGSKLLKDGDFSKCEMKTCIKLLFTIFRADRFVSYYFVEHLKSGTITKILNRIVEIN